MFVLVIAIGCSAIVTTQMSWWIGPPMILFPILLLYGIAAVLLGYVISHFVTGALKSFMATAGISLLSYVIVAIAFSVSYFRTIIYCLSCIKLTGLSWDLAGLDLRT